MEVIFPKIDSEKTSTSINLSIKQKAIGAGKSQLPSAKAEGLGSKGSRIQVKELPKLLLEPSAP